MTDFELDARVTALEENNQNGNKFKSSVMGFLCFYGTFASCWTFSYT